MGLKNALLVALFATSLDICSAVPLFEIRDDICSSDIYGELSPILKQYPIAVAFCSAIYPVSCTSGGRRNLLARSTSSTSTTPIKPLPTASTASPTSAATKTNNAATTGTQASSSVDLRASAWSKGQRQPLSVVKTICSCIEIPKACPTKSTSTTKQTTSSTTSIATSVPTTTGPLILTTSEPSVNTPTTATSTTSSVSSSISSSASSSTSSVSSSTPSSTTIPASTPLTGDTSTITSSSPSSSTPSTPAVCPFTCDVPVITASTTVATGSYTQAIATCSSTRAAAATGFYSTRISSQGSDCYPIQVCANFMFKNVYGTFALSQNVDASGQPNDWNCVNLVSTDGTLAPAANVPVYYEYNFIGRN